MNVGGETAPSGELGLVVIRGGQTFVVDPEKGFGMPPAPSDLGEFRSMIEHGCPQSGLPDEVNVWRLRNQRNLWRGYGRLALARRLKIPHIHGALYLRKICGDGRVLDLGLASLRVVTTAGVNKLVAAMNTTDAATFVAFKFHGYGTGSTAEAIGDTALVTELTTEYNPNSTRPTGTQTVGASNNIYRSVATLTPDSGTPVLREHGLLSQAATGGGTLWDRTVFATVTLDSALGDSLQTTYEATFAAGG